MGQQYEKEHATTVIVTAAVSAARFVGLDGAHATSAGGLHDLLGISETEGAVGQAVSLITDYTGLVEASAAIAYGDFVKPAADGSGKAMVGTATDYCGRAMGVATAAGQLVEVHPLPHRHA